MQTTHPPKEAVRNWLQQRQAERKPVPTPEQIRRELSWGMLPNNKSADCVR